MEQQYATLLESLELLSLSLDEQRKYLPDFADIPDDVISSFESAFLLLPILVEGNRLSRHSIAALLRLYNKVQWCLRNLDLDDFSGGEWAAVRKMAKDTIQLMVQ